MRTHVERGCCPIVSRLAAALAAVAMLAACASEPSKTEVPGQPPAVPPSPAAPAPPPAGAPPVVKPPTAPAPPPRVTRPTPPAPPGGTRPPEAPPASAAPAVPEGTSYFMHTVRYTGETVSIIAAWYLGDKMRYDVLATANPEINPERIRMGMRIKIPENVMKTHEAMPKEFVDGFYKRPPTERVPPTGQRKEEEPQLIGPKESPPK